MIDVIGIIMFIAIAMFNMVLMVWIAGFIVYETKDGIRKWVYFTLLRKKRVFCDDCQYVEARHGMHCTKTQVTEYSPFTYSTGLITCYAKNKANLCKDYLHNAMSEMLPKQEGK